MDTRTVITDAKGLHRIRHEWRTLLDQDLHAVVAGYAFQRVY